MSPSALAPALLGAPWQVVVIAVLVLGLFSPHLLPKIGRMLGRLVRSETLRRLGLSSIARSASRPSRPVQPAPEPAPAVEILMPERPAPMLRAQTERSLASSIEPRRSLPTWLVGTGVAAAAAAIFWLLLHSR